MRTLLAVLLSLAPGPALSQQPGYTPSTAPTDNEPIVGLWLHDAVQTHGALAGVRVWTQMEIRADGEIVEDYFTENPTLGTPISFSRLFSTWTSGTFVDPDETKGTFAVMRLAPYLSQTYRPDSDSYSSIRGGLLPVFRRFALSNSDNQMALWGSTVLEFPGSTAVASLPDDLEIREFRRVSSAITAVEDATWGRVKTRSR